MSEFRTHLPSHAIERCTASIMFNPPVPAKAFEKFYKSHSERLTSYGFRSVGGPTNFNVDVMTGRVTTATEGGPKVFLGIDGQTQVIIAPHFVSVTTPQYVRWSHFYNLCTKALAPLIEDYSGLVSAQAVKLEYWDRFLWTGTWEDFEIGRLIVDEADFVTKRAKSAAREWHSHSGWFEYLNAEKRLVNVNIDVAEVLLDGATPTPTVGIYSMMQDQPATPEGQEQFEAVPALEKLDALHEQLNTMFASLLVNEMAIKVGLSTGG